MHVTPVEARGLLWLKRDDLYEHAGVRGGKVRACLALVERAEREGAQGMVTAGSRHSPQVEIVAALTERYGLRFRAHVPAGRRTPQLEFAVAHGAELVSHRPGYNSVIVARAREDAIQRGWHEVPFGMECREAVDAALYQCQNLPDEMRRLVVAVGSGMTLAGITWGMAAADRLTVPIVGVCVGADPTRRLDRWAHPFWRAFVELEQSEAVYGRGVPSEYEGVPLDAEYEAKVLPYLLAGDVFWIVGRRLDGRIERQLRGSTGERRGVG
jgi:1-aminocyclopropane-1-carboxylate deaminase/D-cysteine desulfhydrase-like pyridoxal-dependent ACC family enzyme